VLRETQRDVKPGFVDHDWFVATLEARKVSQRQLAAKLDVDPASVHRLLTRKRPLRLDEAVAISRILYLPVMEILSHAGIDVAPPRYVVAA
jgi:plasmid maintenance system antidote protein VapI